MAIRTASKRAYLQGEGAKRQEWGVSTVIMNKRGNPCPQCRPFCGKVFIDDVWSGGKRSDGKWPLLSEAIAQGLYHPRCKDSHTTWFPELEQETPLSEAEERRQEAGYEQQQKVTGAERQADKYRRLEEYSLDSDNRKKYAQRAQVWEEQVENAGVSGILKDKETGIWLVTEDAIEAIPEVQPYSWNDEAVDQLREAHRTLLRTVKVLEVGVEAGAVYDTSMKLIEQVIGSVGHVDLPRTEVPHILIHNHPSSLTFSATDVASFILDPELEMMTAVGNRGNVFLMQKTKHYNAAEFLKAYGTELQILKQTESVEKYAAEMNRFLKEAEQYGIYFVARG